MNDAINILNKIADLLQNQTNSKIENEKEKFTRTLGVDKEEYNSLKNLLDEYDRSSKIINDFNQQIQDCDKNIKNYDKSIKNYQDKYNNATTQQKKDYYQKKLNDKKNSKKEEENKKKQLNHELDLETKFRLKSQREFRRKTGKPITKGILDSNNSTTSAINALNAGKMKRGMNLLKGFKGNVWVMLAEAVISAIRWGINKSTEYMKLYYENYLRQLNASATVSFNTLKAATASWQDAVTGAYESYDLFISSQEALLEAQNATELANLKMANTWTNWIWIVGELNKREEVRMELEQKIQENELKNAHQRMTLVNELVRKTDEYIKQQEHAMRGFQVDRGMSSAQYAAFENWMLGQGESFARFNKTIEDVLKMQSSYTEQSGRAINFSENDNLKSIAVGRLVGDENLINFQSQMQLFNHSVSESADIMYEMYKDVNKMGLSQKKVTKDVLANLKLANKYDFKNGTKGFIELAKWAENARFNLSSLGNMIEKVQSGGLEGVITQSAKLQVLGGNFARYADPIRMMYNAYSDPEEYAKQVQSMLKGMGTVNKVTGETEFNREENILIRAAADALGMSTEDAKNMIREDNKKRVVKSQMRSSTLSEEQKDAVANKAQRNATTGKWEVMTLNGTPIEVDNVTKEDLDNIVSNNKDEAAIQYAQSTLSFVEKIEGTTKEINAKMGLLTFSNFAQMSKEQMKDVLEHYTKYAKDKTDTINQNRIDSTEKQKETLDELTNMFEKYIEDRDLIKATEDENKKKYEEYRKKLERIKASEENTENKKTEYNNKVQEAKNNKNANYSENFKQWQDIVSKKHEVSKAYADELIEKGDYLGGYTAKIKSYYDMINQRVAAGIIGLFGVKTSNVNFKKEDVSDPNSKKREITTLPASNVKPIHDGTVTLAKPDKNDSAIFAKTGGPFDTLFNGIFGKINDIYSNLNNNRSNVTPIEPIGKSQFVSSDDYDGGIDKQISAYEIANNINSNIPKEISLKPLEVKFSGSIKLESNGQSIDIMNLINNNPMLMRQLSQMISDEVGKSINGGRSILQYSYMSK